MPEQTGMTGDGASDAGAGWVLAGRYRVLDRLGSGAMADVYRAHDETLDRDVAVKVFRRVIDDGDTAGAARRELELQCLAQLSHPNLITLFDGQVSDADDESTPSFLALELVEGPTLAAILRDGPLPEDQARLIGAQIADALAYIHARGMVHRDVKPANILLGSDSDNDPTAVRARLSDFGIVRLVDSAQVTAADLTVGTAYYLAPEQARSAAVGPPADVYALGLLLLEALTGRRAFEGGVPEVLVARLSRDPDIPADLPQPWPQLLRAMTAQDPAQRPTAADVARTLRDASTATAIAPVAAAPFGAAPLAAAAAAAPFDDAAAATRTVPSLRPPVAPAASFPAQEDLVGAEAAESSGRGRMYAMLAAAAVFVAIIAGAGWFLFQPTGSPGPTGPTVPAGGHTQQALPSGSSSSSGHGHGQGHAVGVADIGAGSGASSSRSHSVTSSSAPTTRRTPTSRPTSRSTSAPPASSTPRTSSSAPTTSSSPPASSAPPPPTSTTPKGAANSSAAAPSPSTAVAAG